MRILLVDNNDSFTRNLEHLLVAATGVAPVVAPYAGLDGVDPRAWDMIVLSPGPGAPGEYPGHGRLLDAGVPVLGVCLGMQAINAHFGGATDRLDGCVHGRTDTIVWDGAPRLVARYHSLHASRVADCLEVIAANAAGVPMALRHRTLPILGYQFHPESFLTPQGREFIDHATLFFGLRRT
ncbi:MAG: aminodeoxychorismate/anthranilate synthase component II [Desulfovibrionaceae bacterium]